MIKVSTDIELRECCSEDGSLFGNITYVQPFDDAVYLVKIFQLKANVFLTWKAFDDIDQAKAWLDDQLRYPAWTILQA